MTKNRLKKGKKLQHLPDSSADSRGVQEDWSENTEKLSANTVTFISCSRQTVMLTGATRGRREVGVGEGSFPFSPLVASASIMVSLLLQLMKATVLAEILCFLCFPSGSSYTSRLSADVSGRCCTFLPLLTYFCDFTFPGFPFTLILVKFIYLKPNKIVLFSQEVSIKTGNNKIYLFKQVIHRNFKVILCAQLLYLSLSILLKDLCTAKVR